MMKTRVAVLSVAACIGSAISVPLAAQDASFPAPTNLWAAQTSPTTVSLSWSKVPGVRYYRLFSLDAAGDAQSVGEARANGDWWVHTIGLRGVGVIGQPLRFAIEAVSEGGVVSRRVTFNEVIPVKATPSVAPAPASAVASVARAGEVNVNWDAVPGVTAFSINRMSTPGGPKVVCRLCPPTGRFLDTEFEGDARVRYRIFGYTASGSTRPVLSNEVAVSGATKAAKTIATRDSAAPTSAVAPRGTIRVDAKPGSCLSLGAEGNILVRLADGTVQSYERVFFRNGGAKIAPSPAMKPVAGVSDVVAVSTSGAHSLALRADGTVLAWGDNGHGQIGSELAIERRFGHALPRVAEQPVPVKEIVNAIAVAAGGEHSAALLSDGTIRTWGLGAFGVPGDGSMQRNQSNEYDHLSPARVVGINNAVAIAASGLSTFALLPDGTIRAWGSNTLSLGAHGTLGTGSDDDAAAPTPVKGISNAAAVVATGGGGVALLTDGTLRGWGVGYGTGHRPKDQATNTSVPIEGIHGAIAISPYMALLNDGSIREFPYKPSWSTPNFTNAVSIASDPINRIALLADGRLMAWGHKRWYPSGPVMRANLGAETARSCAARPSTASR